MTNGAVALERSFARLADLIANVTTDQLATPSGCEGWDVKALIDHVVGAAWRYTFANQGHELDPITADLVGDAPQRAIAQVAEVNVASWRVPGALDGIRTYPFAEVTADDALWFNVGEITVHTWDLAIATGQDVTLDSDAVNNLFCFYLSMPMDDYRGSGAFAPAVAPPESASVQDRLLAYVGRKARPELSEQT